MKHPFTILNVSGPYREPRELVFSYDYSVQRAHWPTPYAVRVKVAIPEELDYCKKTVLDIEGGTPGQQVLINQMLSRRIADQKLHIGNEEGMFLERFDVMIGPFTGPLAHLFSRLETWMNEIKPSLQQEILNRVPLKTPGPV
ncbi:MAG: hypothetical protein ACREJU_16460 [Nitrospiraceae bacterium]